MRLPNPIRKLLVGGTVALATAALATPALAVPPISAKKSHIKACFVYVAPIGDAGWTYQHNLGRLAMQKNLHGKVSTAYVESVPEGADAVRVIRQFATSGCNLIFTTSFGYMNPTIRVAREFPNVAFEHATGYKRAHNVGTYMPRLYQGRYLAGMLAGMMTKTNKLGFVGAYPIPEVIRAIDSFTLGARSVNPKVTVHVVWINAWYDPAKARQAADTLMDQGVDVITNHTDSPAVVQAAAERKVFCLGYHSDMKKYGGKYQLAAVVHRWGKFYTKIGKEVLDGTWKSRNVWGGISRGMVDLVDISPVVPKKVRDEVLAARKKIIAGTLHPFAGPVIAQDGHVAVPKGKVMSDDDMLKLDYYVKGVASSLPKSN